MGASENLLVAQWRVEEREYQSIAINSNDALRRLENVFLEFVPLVKVTSQRIGIESNGLKQCEPCCKGFLRSPDLGPTRTSASILLIPVVPSLLSTFLVSSIQIIDLDLQSEIQTTNSHNGHKTSIH
jgi:hypothetical protein